MRAVVSRVTEASVTVEDEVIGEITKPGLLVLLGITHSDDEQQVETMARKLHELRILRNEESAASINAPMLIVSQFTLYGETRKGRRPSWTSAAPGDVAEPLVNAVIARLRARGATVATGRFGAEMAVRSVNDGPFTVLVEC